MYSPCALNLAHHPFLPLISLPPPSFLFLFIFSHLQFFFIFISVCPSFHLRFCWLSLPSPRFIASIIFPLIFTSYDLSSSCFQFAILRAFSLTFVLLFHIFAYYLHFWFGNFSSCSFPLPSFLITASLFISFSSSPFLIFVSLRFFFLLFLISPHLPFSLSPLVFLILLVIFPLICIPSLHHFPFIFCKLNFPAFWLQFVPPPLPLVCFSIIIFRLHFCYFLQHATKEQILTTLVSLIPPPPFPSPPFRDFVIFFASYYFLYQFFLVSGTALSYVVHFFVTVFPTCIFWYWISTVSFPESVLKIKLSVVSDKMNSLMREHDYE